MQRISHGRLRLRRFHLLGFLQHFVDRAFHVERLLGNVVVLTVHDLLEAAYRVVDLDVAPLQTSKLLGHVERLREELLDLAGTRHRELLVLAELVDAQNRDDVLEVLVTLQHSLDGLRRVVVLLANHARIENARRRSQWIHSRIDAQLRDLARKHGGRIEVSKGRSRRRIGQIVGRHVNGLHRRHRALLGGGDALLQLAHFGGKVGLISDGGGHTAQQRRYLGTRLGETENVVDEQQRVGPLFVAAILRNGQRGEGHAQARSGRLGHLAVDESGLRLRGILDVHYARLLHFQPEIVALASELANSSEHRKAAVLKGHVVDELHDDDGLADAGATEQADLAALQERLDQVDDLHAGLEHLHRGGLLVERRRLAMDGHTLFKRHGAQLVHGFANDVEHAAEGAAANRYGDGTTQVEGFHAAHHAFGRRS